MRMPNDLLRIGYVGGHAKRLNERIIDDQWVRYLGEYAELAMIPPYSFIKVLGGSLEQWMKEFPHSLRRSSERLQELCRKYQVDTIYINLPAIIPHLLMARTYAGLDLGFVFLAHSVGSETWLRQWIAIAPWLTERDLVLVSSKSSHQALQLVSRRYGIARHIPLCIAVGDNESIQPAGNANPANRLFSIGRIEEVKNIHILLECFAEMRKYNTSLRLSIAGEYTGASTGQIVQYQSRLAALLGQMNLQDSVEFLGPLSGTDKEEQFRQSHILVNLSTDPGETFGFNLIEAKSWGMPIVCANWDGFRELVAPGVNGYLIDCDWEGPAPVLNKLQIADRCLELAGNPDLYNRLAEQSLADSRNYDYRIIMPRIIDAIRNAGSHRVKANTDAISLASTRLSELSSLYCLENLQGLPFYNDSILSMMSTEASGSLEDWYPRVKPVLYHFARRCEHAEL